MQHAGIEVNPWIRERGSLHSVLPGRVYEFAGGSLCLSGGPETLSHRRWLSVQLQPQGNAVRLFSGAQPHGQHTGRRKWLAGLGWLGWAANGDMRAFCPSRSHCKRGWHRYRGNVMLLGKRFRMSSWVCFGLFALLVGSPLPSLIGCTRWLG
jgi:hypothetical protein